MIAIISDIHGNYAALCSVLEQIDRLGVQDIICLGDVGGYYSQINQCCDALRERGILTLMGNHDWYLAAGRECPRSNSANRCLDYQRAVIRPDNLAWLSGLKPQAEVHGMHIVHGGWSDPLDEYVTPSSAYFADLPGRVFASGHTHVPCIWEGAGKLYCNPGSVGQPRDGDARAAFAIWDGAAFALLRCAYDISAIQSHMREAGFTPYFYENLELGARIGGRIDRLERRD